MELDVREDNATRNDPFEKIMNAIHDLTLNGKLVLHTPFIPEPLLKVMKSKGFEYEIQEEKNNHYITTFILEEE
ncbi:DUF2249 domain-containing protein [Evansella tamaricis]|uniref:DUF2249 domain-containing protein n=1 Tax=Evansella tamaricis TaxID=2069301 RepID=A0ABS6JK98_9BACI|nr:DUF2249 domain-containing protein [Evansella tamaricis]